MRFSSVPDEGDGDESAADTPGASPDDALTCLVPDKPGRGTFDPLGSTASLFVARAQANGLIVRNLQDTVALCPPLIISEGEIDELLRKFGKALDETAEALTRR